MANTPLPQRLLAFLNPDGKTVSLPWYRWFQQFSDGSGGTEGPPGPEGPAGAQGPAGPSGSNEPNVIDLLTTALLDEPQPTFRFYGDLAGKPTDAQELFAVPMRGDEFFPKDLPLNLGFVAIAPTGSVTFPIKVNGVSVGTMNVASSATTATWTFSSAYQAAPGDIMSFIAPSPPDATLSSPRYTFVGTRLT